MAYLDQPINLNELPEDTGGDYSPVPAGDYTVVIKDADVVCKKNGVIVDQQIVRDYDTAYIKLRLDITGPSHVGRVVFANVNIRNQSAKAEQIGRAQLGVLMIAAGVTVLQDTDQLIGASIGVKLAVREARTDQATGKTYEASNEVKAYKPLDGAAPMAAKPAFAQAPAAAAPAKAAPPWARK
jgi:hypothetical protein